MSKQKYNEPSTADLLAELGTLDEVEVRIPTAVEHSQSALPKWCELIMEVKRTNEFPINLRIPMNRHDGELIIEVIHSVLHPHAGGSIRDGLWLELDKVIDRIMRRVDKGKEPLKADVGEARGLTTAIARMTNPYEPSEDEIKGVAMDRYRIRRGLPLEDDDED